MKITDIKIEKGSDYTTFAGKYRCSITVEGQHNWDPKIQIELTEEQLAPILEIIRGAAVHALDDGVARFREQVLASFNPPVEAAAIEGQSSDQPF